MSVKNIQEIIKLEKFEFENRQVKWVIEYESLAIFLN